ncbi:MAG: hypothetical protein ACXVCE_04350, partial [Bacteriovorax sp.]
TVGYLGDLRVSMNRKLIREWRNFYGSFLQKSPEIKEAHFCRYYQTALMSTNAYSKRNLVDTKIPNLYYKELATYHMINIVGKFGPRSHKENVRFGKEEDRAALIKFLENDHKRRLFGHDWRIELDRRLKEWNQFKMSDFILVLDKNHNIMAATSVWSPIKTKQIIVPHIPFFYKMLSKAASFTPGLCLKPLPKAMVPIEILYLNQISFAPQLTFKEKQKVFSAIVNLVFSRDFNMLAYCDFDRESLLKNMRHLITQKMPMGFYSVHYKDSEDGAIRDELFLNPEELSPAFDMALV